MEDAKAQVAWAQMEIDKLTGKRLGKPKKVEEGHLLDEVVRLMEVKLLWASFRSNPSPQNMKECATRLDELLLATLPAEEKA